MLFPDEAHLPTPTTEFPFMIDVLSNLTDFSKLVELIEVSGTLKQLCNNVTLFRVQLFNLTDVLNNNTFTILAPTNDAFSLLSDEELDNLVHI